MSATPSEVFRRLAQDVITEGNLDLIEDLVTDDYVDHTGGDGGPKGYRETLENVRNVFHDMKMTVYETLEDGDRAAVRFVVTARHVGEFMGVPATDRAVSWEGIAIIRVEDGKMAERWNVSDLLGIVEQITRETTG